MYCGRPGDAASPQFRRGDQILFLKQLEVMAHRHRCDAAPALMQFLDDFIDRRLTTTP